MLGDEMSAANIEIQQVAKDLVPKILSVSGNGKSATWRLRKAFYA